MARKTNHLKMTPLMSLAVFAIFALMIPMFTIAGGVNKTAPSRAQVATPEPTPEAVYDYYE